MQADRPNSPIFIVGYMHTGTSLIKAILKRDPSVWALAGESHFFQDLAKVRREFPDLTDEATRRAYVYYLIKLAYLGHKHGVTHREKWVLADFGLTESRLEEILVATSALHEHESLFGPVIDCLTEFAGKERWIEKTPVHVHFLAQIIRLMPDVKVIEMVRDPRAALASRKLRQTDSEWLDAKERAELQEVDRSTNYDPILDSMMWKAAIHAAREVKRNRPQNIVSVRYEDLVADPAATVGRVCEFAGLPYSDEMLNVGWINSATLMKEQADRTAKSGISTSAVEKWRNELTPTELFICQFLLKSEMRELGYEPVPAGLGARLKAPLILAGTAVNLIQRMSKKRRSVERARDSFSRIQRRLLRDLGFMR